MSATAPTSPSEIVADASILKRPVARDAANGVMWVDDGCADALHCSGLSDNDRHPRYREQP
jgi:hypothetical protein